MAANGTECPTSGDAKCTSCDDGYHLEGLQCIENQCTCDNGVGATGTDCPTHGSVKCTSCDDGYHAEGLQCINPCDDGYHYQDVDSTIIFSESKGCCNHKDFDNSDERTLNYYDTAYVTFERFIRVLHQS